MINEFNLAL